MMVIKLNNSIYSALNLTLFFIRVSAIDTPDVVLEMLFFLFDMYQISVIV